MAQAFQPLKPPTLSAQHGSGISLTTAADKIVSYDGNAMNIQPGN
jgi:hypothetical protein